MTYYDIIRKFNLELETRKYASSTIATYNSCLTIFLKAMNGKPKPLPFDEIKQFLSTINNVNYHKQFTATIRHLYELVLNQPFNIKDIPYPRKTEYLPEIFSVQEIYNLVNSYDNLKHKAIIQIMYSCGLRTGEVPKIKVSDIDSHRSVVRIAGAKGFKDRYVPIPMQTIELLRTYYKSYHPKKFLFVGQYGEEYSSRSIQQIFWQGVNKIRCNKKVRPHCLRHSRATHLKEANIDIKDIKDFLGHNDIKTTEIYLKLAKETLVNRIIEADNKIAQLIPSTQKMIAV